jgi:hypothetical protein
MIINGVECKARSHMCHSEEYLIKEPLSPPGREASTLGAYCMEMLCSDGHVIKVRVTPCPYEGCHAWDFHIRECLLHPLVEMVLIYCACGHTDLVN